MTGPNDLINQVRSSPRVPRLRRTAIARELRGHLDEARRDLELSGWHPDEALIEAENRLGDPLEIAEGFALAYRSSRPRRLALAFGLAATLLAGAYGASGTLVSANVTPHTVAVHVHGERGAQTAPHP